MMEIRVERDTFTKYSTTGRLFMDGKFFCYTLEPVTREGIKVPGQTAIPEGRYKVEMIHSERFGRMTPHLLAVPDFEAIEIHAGNWPTDTEGCTLVGMQRRVDYLVFSDMALEPLYSQIEAAAGEVWITYENITGMGMAA